MRFYPIKVCCPKCGKEGVVTETSFSINGQIRFHLLCVLCGINMESILSWEDTILYCAQQELVQVAVTPTVSTVQ